MKISGSHTEKIESMSKNIFRVKEEAIITAVTEKLSGEGKHVINIIHGTPTVLLGTITKSITFLWEGDDKEIKELEEKKKLTEELERLKKEKEKKEKEEKDRIRKTKQEAIDSCEKEIKDLEERIALATFQEPITEKSLKQKEFKDSGCKKNFFWGLIGLVVGIALFIYAISDSTFWCGVIGLFSTLLGGLVTLLSYVEWSDIRHRTDERKEKMRRMPSDKENLEKLKTELELKKKKLKILEKT